jgi:secreted Zn-dependent insulinase-like peptidase
MELFIDMFTNEIKNVEEIVNESTFNNFKTEQKEEFFSSMRGVRHVASEYLAKLMVDSFHLDYDMYKIIDQITFEDVRKFVPKVLKKLKFKVLAQGNITKAETLSIVNILDKNFNYEIYNEVGW